VTSRPRPAAAQPVRTVRALAATLLAVPSHRLPPSAALAIASGPTSSAIWSLFCPVTIAAVWTNRAVAGASASPFHAVHPLCTTSPLVRLRGTVPATPYFLPAPIGLARSGLHPHPPPRSARSASWLEVASRPFAGFVALCPSRAGVALSERPDLDRRGAAATRCCSTCGESLLVRAASLLVHGPLAEGMVLNPTLPARRLGRPVRDHAQSAAARAARRRPRPLPASAAPSGASPRRSGVLARWGCCGAVGGSGASSCRARLRHRPCSTSSQPLAGRDRVGGRDPGHLPALLHAGADPLRGAGPGLTSERPARPPASSSPRRVGQV